MHWPDIFFKSRKPKPETELPPPFKLAPESAQPASPAPAETQPQPPTIKPVPATATVVPQIATIPTPRKIELKTEAKVEPKPEPKAKTPTTPTLPATHGVVLRPPTSLSGSTSTPQITPPRASEQPPLRTPSAPMKNIEQLMAEADPVQTLRQTGNVRILAPLTAPDTAPLDPPPASPNPPPAKVEPAPIAAAPIPLPVASTPAPEIKKVDPLPVAVTPAPIPPPAPQSTPVSSVATDVPAPADNDSPFILQPGPASVTKIIPPSAPALTPFGSIFRRKAKMTDVARIVLPPKREDSQRLAPPVPLEPSPTVVPAAFPVAAMKARTSPLPPVNLESTKATPISPSPSVAPEKIVTDSKPAASAPVFSAPQEDSFLINPTSAKPEPVNHSSIAPSPEFKPEPAPFNKAPDFTTPEKSADAKIDPAPMTPPFTEAKPVEPLIASSDAPKIDPEAHKPEPTATPQPKVDPEAHKPEPKPAQPVPVAALSEPSTAIAPEKEKREFHLSNGERVAGTVLSETPESVYIEHSTLGVLTIPRANIAKRLVEIILINGDRIVGDIMAETADTLYVRHASLGMLTVPRAQRSTRVVEAILKDGDRILGEVLTETDTFTVIRSATLGTITIPHTKLAMLNRKIEQVEMKALPPPEPELNDKPSG